METLNNSSAAEQRIFSPIRAVQKTGNTYSIPPFSEPSAGEKSLAASSCRIIQSFLMIIFLRNRIVKVSISRITLAVSSTPITITASRSRASLDSGQPGTPPASARSTTRNPIMFTCFFFPFRRILLIFDAILPGVCCIRRGWASGLRQGGPSEPGLRRGSCPGW